MQEHCEFDVGLCFFDSVFFHTSKVLDQNLNCLHNKPPTMPELPEGEPAPTFTETVTLEVQSLLVLRCT